MGNSFTISVLYRAHLCIKCSLGISNFLEEISRLSHPIVFLNFFALIPEEGFLISPCYSLELCIQMDICFLFSFAVRFRVTLALNIAKPLVLSDLILQNSSLLLIISVLQVRKLRPGLSAFKVHVPRHYITLPK